MSEVAAESTPSGPPLARPERSADGYTVPRLVLRLCRREFIVGKARHHDVDHVAKNPPTVLILNGRHKRQTPPLRWRLKRVGSLPH